MSRLYLMIILFVLLAFEGVALDLLPATILESESLIISHWMLIFLIYIALFYDVKSTYHGVIYAAIFGLLVDIVYTDILGVYMFAYFITVYIVFLMGRSLKVNLVGTILLGIVGIVLADALIYFIYYFISITTIPIEDYAYYRLLPTVLANIIFLIILYPIVNKRLLRWQEKELKL